MPVKLHRCKAHFAKLKGHPCWKVEKALKDMGVDFELVPGPAKKDKREAVLAGTGQKLYPAIQFEDGSWYREESREMEKTIRAGKLLERAHGTPPPLSG